MNDLISRQDVLDLWEQYRPYIATKACKYDAKLRRLPSAEPQRKKGKWIEQDDSWDGVYYECSECGCYFEEWDEQPTYNFCPNCGADMRGEEE